MQFAVAYVVFVVVTQPLPRDGDMAEDHRALEAGQLPMVWTRGRSPKSERRKVCSWTVQNEMRGVLGQVSAGAAERIFESANPGQIRA